MNDVPLTRQGVRNLDKLGPKPLRIRRASDACPPHLPAEQWERDETGFLLIRRCRLCKTILDTRE